MENIGASVSAVLTAEKKEVEVKKVVEEEEVDEEYHQMENEMIFFLSEAPEYQISAVAEWAENSRGDIVVGADTYFLHVLTGRRCESAWGCLVGWSEPDKKEADEWETLCQHIEDLRGIEEIICTEKRVEV